MAHQFQACSVGTSAQRHLMDKSFLWDVSLHQENQKVLKNVMKCLGHFQGSNLTYMVLKAFFKLN